MARKLERSLSLFDVVGLGVNGVIGTGIFLLPGIAAGVLGPASILSLLFAGGLTFLIAACFAEVSASFEETGGAYLYTLRTFGDAAGFLVGWMTLIVTITACGALANALVTATATYWPEVAQGLTRVVAIIATLTVLAILNLRGVRIGARVSSVFTIAKLAPLLVFVCVGAFMVDVDRYQPFAPQGLGSNFFEATLILLYAFLGFESITEPAGETKNPRRVVPIAIVLVMVMALLLYSGVLMVAIGTLPGIEGHANPVVAASETFLGPRGALLIGIGAIVSIAGVNAALALVAPRRIFALAKNGHLPAVLARLGRNGVPSVAILSLFAISCVTASLGSFKTLALVSMVARFVQYMATCAAALRLQRISGGQRRPNQFRLPFGPLIPLAALGLCVLVLYKSAQADPKPIVAGGIALTAGALVYLGLYAWRARTGKHRARAVDGS